MDTFKWNTMWRYDLQPRTSCIYVLPSDSFGRSVLSCPVQPVSAPIRASISPSLLTYSPQCSPVAVHICPYSKVQGAHLGPTGPRWAPCWPHELCYLCVTAMDLSRSANLGDYGVFMFIFDDYVVVECWFFTTLQPTVFHGSCPSLVKLLTVRA